MIEKKKKDAYLPFVEQHLRKVFTFPHIFGKVRFLNKFWKRRVLNNPNLINYFIKERYDVNLGFLEGISTIYISQKNGGKKVGYIHTSLYEMRGGKADSKELEAYQRLDSMIEAQGVKNVRFLGFSANPYSVIKICDCVVLASYFEGCPLVLLESCVLKKAIISSDIPTSKEVLSDNGNLCAEFFENKNAEALAQSMQKVINDTAYKATLETLSENLAKKRDISLTINEIESTLGV